MRQRTASYGLSFLGLYAGQRLIVRRVHWLLHAWSPLTEYRDCIVRSLSGFFLPTKCSFVSRAARFDVTKDFILQEAAWLYERHLSQVRAQMKKANDNKTSSSKETGKDQSRAKDEQEPGSADPGGENQLADPQSCRPF